jgi:hypothetical protein
MAGSLRYFRYQDDSGASYSVQIDESNGEATCGGVALMLNRTAAHPRLGAGDKMRYCLASLSTNPNIKRKFYVGNPLAVAQIQAGAAFLAGVYPTAGDAATVTASWTVTARRGEKFRTAPALNATAGDTGLTDGDVPRDA